MDGKANVKSIMAKFSNNPTEDVHSRQVKVAGQPSLVTKPPFEPFPPLKNASPPARPGSNLQKSASFKPPLGNKPSFQDASDKDPKPPPLKISPVASKFAAMTLAASKEGNEKPGFPKPLGPKPTEPQKDVSKPGFPKAPENKLPGSLPPKNDFRPSGLKPAFKLEPQEAVVKSVPSKVAGVKGLFDAPSQENDPKPPFLKPIPREKPSPHPSPNEGIVNKSKNAFLNQTTPSFLGPKPKLNSAGSPRDAENKSSDGTHSPVCHFPRVSLKPVANQSSTPPVLPKNEGQRNEDTKPSITKNIIFQMNQQESGSASGVAAATKFDSPSRVASTGHWANHSEKEEKDKDLPKRKALPLPFKLGPPPQKPKRPPTVDLKKFQKDHGDSSKKPHSVGLPPPTLPSISAAQATVPQPSPPLPPPPPGSHPSAQVPSLPPRNIKPKPDNIEQENEETYDDLDSEDPGNADESDEELETYEDIDEMRTPSRDDEKKRQKEEKKKSDQEKKEQMKKEQEIRKKFKLVGPIEVIHQARACADFKGGKNDLTFKQGDKIEIIRITDNPEGKWLGRTRGCYGYIKTIMVEIDYDSLKRKPRQPDSDKEVYDDVGDRDSISSGSQTGGGFPPPPADIYDGVEEDDDVQTQSVSQDEDKNNSWPRGLLKILKGKDYQKKSVRETTPKVNVTQANGIFSTSSARQPGKDSGDSDGDVYDDVEPSDFPPPPKEISLGINPKPLSFGRGKLEDRDSQKLKKMEKEFRKKFKYEGDIRVLYTTTVQRSPFPKKRGSKDLQVKPGESIDVIQNVDDTKLLCRNEEGKYGYVQKSCLLDEDEEIYDDIADEGCIYDND
ncbi:FYN-binding protein 1 isoform X2 [Tiliqua scincoides]|uniref:FYN-binding protein 1 isoform X2 n=1 Tax=Tiliqua scincoides TaxID=71010 RepID=UPI0034626B24